MDFLLDSHALLWALGSPEKLSLPAARAIADRNHAVYFSAVSVWELEIKRARGKLTLPEDWSSGIEERGFLELAVTSKHATASARLPWHHQDPFDRMLIAQAQIQGLRFVSRDRVAAAYGVSLLEA
jgi:PIN domain nuclease of toxin-antitoxin system